MGSANSSPPVAPAPADGARTPADVTALLVELGRLVKARQFYPVGHPLLADVMERGFRAFEAELARGGALELELRQGAFRMGGEPFGRGRVDDLAQELVTRAVRRLSFEPGLTPAALERFVATLSRERERVEEVGGFVQALYAEPCPGIRVNEIDYAAALAERQQGADGGAPEGMAGAVGDALADGDPAVGVAGLPGAAGAGEGLPLGLLAEALGAGGGDASKPDPLAPQQQLEQSPLEALSDDDRAAALVEALRELDGCQEIVRYREGARNAVVLASTLADQGLPDEGYRALLVLAAHAKDEARLAQIREFARDGLRELARGARLEDLIERSCAPGDRGSLRAAQLLLQLGEDAVPALLRRVETEADLDRRGQLLGILIAMGGQATHELQNALLSGERRRAGMAVRLAGEMQNAGCVPQLVDLLACDDVDLRREAAKALVRIGSNEAIDALVAALESPLDGMPGHAAFCLGVAGGQRSLEVLVATARREGNPGELDLAREAVRALGRMGRPEAAAVLAEVLRRKRFFGRKRLRELQLAAVNALARLPGDGPRQALLQASRHGDRPVREAAQEALRRTGEPAGRGAQG